MSLFSNPDSNGFFGEFGGCFVSETLVQPLKELREAYNQASKDSSFLEELKNLQEDYCGRPTPLYRSNRWEKRLGEAKVYLKREDLLHTGAHKINNTLGQILLAKRLGKKRIIAETGAGQHGVATSSICAKFGMECVIYMGAKDMERQKMNVDRMRLLGAKVCEVTAGQKTLKEAVSESLRDWSESAETTHYVLGSALGPHPFPLMVRNFQSVIGEETRSQILEKEGRLPDLMIACVGGGSNSLGFFTPFLKDASVKMIGVEAGGKGESLGEHAARFFSGSVGIFQGTKTILLSDDNGQIQNTHSISAGLDYAGIGPEHAFLHKEGRIQYTKVMDEEVLFEFQRFSELEGIIPALESTHALAYYAQKAPEYSSDVICVINLSGRGDKDLEIVEGFTGLKGVGEED